MSFGRWSAPIATTTGANATAPARIGRVSRIPQVRVTRYRLLMAAVLVAALAFYMWTAATSAPFDFSSSNADVYNELATAFLHGHTYLPITPPPGLLHLSNPYDPIQNAAFNSAYHDLSLYGGHFYSPWGPTPAITLFAPFRITGLRMSQSFAVALYGFVGLVCAVLLLRALVTRFAPGAPRLLLPVAAIALALTNTVPFLLRRPAQYEVAISSAYCFEMAGLLLLVTAFFGDRLRRWRAALGSLCLGLAVGGRPTMAVGGAVVLAAGVWAVRRRGEGRQVLVYIFAPFVVCGLLLLLYNAVRFGSLTDFGDRYELAGIDQTTAKFYRPEYLLPGLYSYLVVPARLALTFPHAFLQTAAAAPFSLPRGYIGSGQLPAEPVGGVFTTMPITLVLLALPVLWWRREREEQRALLVATGMAGLGLLIIAVLSFGLFATTQRYEVDFATLFLIPAFLIWALLLTRERVPVRRRVMAFAAVILVGFGAAVGLAVSFSGYSDLLRLEHPRTFAALEDATSPFATAATVIVGKPELARVDNGQLPVSAPPTATQAGASAWLGQDPLSLVVISPGNRTLGIGATVAAGPHAPPPSSLVIRVSSPGRKPVTVPVLGAGIRLPVSLHWGLNRIRVSLAGRAPSAEELQLGNLQLIS